MTGMAYTSRQRVIDALNHREPDRIPLDLGGSFRAFFHTKAYDRFIEYTGLLDDDDNPRDSFLRLGNIRQPSENVLKHLKVDIRTAFLQPPSEPTPNIELENGTLRLTEEWGITLAKNESSLYLDVIDNPLKGDLTRERLAAFRWPDPLQEGRFFGLAEEAERLHDTGCAILAEASIRGVLEWAQDLHGMEATLMDMALNPLAIEDLFDRITEFLIGLWERMLEIMGENIDICMPADDLGMQIGPIMSPEMYRKLLKPRHTRLFSHIKKAAKTDVKVVLHSCGSVRALIPDLIETGIDGLNPVQTSAVDMDAKELKREFGSDLCFWGGGIDTQQILPRGTISEIKDEVKRMIDMFAPGGGYIFSPVPNIQPDVPPENICAMWEAFLEHCQY